MQQNMHAIPAMAFYHPNGLIPAWTQAKAFAGDGGRLATLPDIIDARIATGVSRSPWTRYFTTTTAEYVGLSPGGAKVIAVAHGVGPMASMAGAVGAYSFQHGDKTRSRNGGRIPQEAFHNLLAGAFGPVEVIDFASYCARYKYPFMEKLKPEAAAEDPLLLARLGPNAGAYLQRHAKEAELYRDDDQRGSGPRRTHPTGRIIGVEGANDPHYRYREPEEGMAFAHLMAISCLSQMHCPEDEDRLSALFCEVSPHNWTDGTRFAALRSPAVAGDIHPGFSMRQALSDPNQRAGLYRPTGINDPHGGFFSLVMVSGAFFTEYPKVGAALDTGEPEYAVTEYEPIGDPVSFTVEASGYYGFFRYDTASVRALAPAGANAYHLIGVGVSPDGASQSGTAQFHRVKVDRSQRLLREAEVFKDTDMLIHLAQAQEG